MQLFALDIYLQHAVVHVTNELVILRRKHVFNEIWNIIETDETT